MTLEELIAKQTPRVRDAFLTSLKDIGEKSNIGLIEAMISRGDIEGIARAMDIGPHNWVNVQVALTETYGLSGVDTVNKTTWKYSNGQKAVVRFDTLSPRSEAYLREYGGAFISGLDDDAKKVIANTVGDGYAFGRRNKEIALDIAGRIGPNGRRSGGMIGLNSVQTEWVKNMRTYLQQDPIKAISMTKRDKRFDKVIIKSAKDGKPLTKAQIDKIINRYTDNLVMSRALTIARTETIKAVEMGKYEAWKQGLEKTGIPETAIDRKWVHTGRAMIDRVQHVSMNGKTVEGMVVPFITPDGTAMLHPHDTTYGAGADHIINCMCRADYSINRERLTQWRVSMGQ
jgi:hypothetical protein